MTRARYIETLVVSLLSCVTAVLAFNLVVDPFGLQIIRSPFTFYKPDIVSYDRPFKSFAVLRLKPRTVILGTSRTALGVDPAYAGFGAENAPVFNLALNGMTLAETRDALECAADAGARRAIIGLDFYNFNIYHELAPSPEVFRCVHRRVEGLPDYLSLDALEASAKAAAKTLTFLVRGGRLPDAPLFANGLENGPARFNSLIARVGQHELFRMSERDYLAQGYRFYPAWTFSFRDPAGHSTFDIFKQALQTARRRHMHVDLFLSPSHARDFETIRVAGLWNDFENWKRQVVEIVMEDNSRHPSDTPTTLWDFSDYNSLSTENLPAEGDVSTQMHWYWESAHFKTALGDLVLSRILGSTAGAAVPPDFGFALNEGNVEEHLRVVRQGQARYHRTHPADVREIEELARSIVRR